VRCLGFEFSVLCSLFSVLCSLFSVLCSLFSVLGSLFSVLGSRFSVLGSRFGGHLEAWKGLREVAAWPLWGASRLAWGKRQRAAAVQVRAEC
jgi:hypothetical protein